MENQFNWLIINMLYSFYLVCVCVCVCVCVSECVSVWDCDLDPGSGQQSDRFIYRSFVLDIPCDWFFPFWELYLGSSTAFQSHRWPGEQNPPRCLIQPVCISGNVRFRYNSDPIRRINKTHAPPFRPLFIYSHHKKTKIIKKKYE